MGDEVSNNNCNSTDFVRNIINEDLENKRFMGVHTRFPPEPNGYLHIGHAKAALVNYALAKDYKGKFNLRFDDTNPAKEDIEFEEAIKNDLKWLGIDWEDRLFYASDYFDKLYEFAENLICEGKAYVDSLTSDEIKKYRGTAGNKDKGITPPGKNSPYRDRTVKENLDLFRKMKNGEFNEGEHVLRAKIDMAHPNLNMRDPVMYRIAKVEHIKTGKKWCIYPMYDYAHPVSDSLEKITHSCCSLEFENHRPLYNWFLENLKIHLSRQIEFARLNLTYTVLSKRLLLQLVNGNHVKGWDDPRMPTLSAMKRRGYTPEAIKDFCQRIGLAKVNSCVDIKLLEHCLRENLNKNAPRVMGVLKPLKITIENYPEEKVEWVDAVNNPNDVNAGNRKVPFAKHLYIEHDDFMEQPPKKFFRLAPGKEVRLRYAYAITCQKIIKNENGEIKELICSYDPESKNSEKKIKGIIHWVAQKYAINAEVRCYDYLFNKPDPTKVDENENWLDNINQQSLQIINNAYLEPSLENTTSGKIFQLERLGYFCVDKDTTKNKLVMNKTIGLKDSYTPN